jgi:hypothetical protein
MKTTLEVGRGSFGPGKWRTSADARSESKGSAASFARICLGAIAMTLFAVTPAVRAADAAAAPATPAPPPCDAYKNYSCMDESLGTGVWERLVNYYALEWGQAGAPSDPKAPASRRDYWPATPQTTPPMPFTEWPYGGATPLGVTRTGSVDSPLMTAIGDTSIGKWMGDTGLQLYGWADVGANISSSTLKPGGNAPAAYLYTPDTVTLDQFVLYLDRFPDTVQKDHLDWGLRLSLLYGENYRYTTAYGLDSWQLLNRNRVNGYDFPMLYGELFIPQVAEGLLLRLGRYISLPDIEAQLAPNNYMYTHSMTYSWDNYTNTGLQSTLALTKQLFLQLGVSVGTEASFMHLHDTTGNPTQYVALPGINGGHPILNPLYPDASFKVDPGAMPSWTGCVRWSSADGGDDVNACADAINKGTWGYNNLQWYGLTAYHKWNDQWHISIETYHEFEKGVPNLNNSTVQAMNTVYGADGGTPFSSLQGILFNNPAEAYCAGNTTTSSSTQPLTCTAGATGIVSYLNYSPDPLNNFSVRPELYVDLQGQRTGVPTRYGNFSLGWQHWWSPQFEARPEILFYHAFNSPAFNGGPFAANPKMNEVILSGDLIWHF